MSVFVRKLINVNATEYVCSHPTSHHPFPFRPIEMEPKLMMLPSVLKTCRNIFGVEDLHAVEILQINALGWLISNRLNARLIEYHTEMDVIECLMCGFVDDGLGVHRMTTSRF